MTFRLRTVITLLILASGVGMYSQSAADALKLRGLELLDRGENDSAMVYLSRALMDAPDDADILGGLAMVYINMGDAQRAVDFAVKGVKDRLNPSSDAYLAGVLGYEKLGNVRLRNKWLEEGLEVFPSDYLLLYHAGRINIPFDKEKGEKYLLRSIYAYPAFAPAHLLLGENMYRRGENLKAVVPLIYYLFLNHNELNSADIVASIERLYSSWSASTQSISKVSNASKGFTTDFRPEEFKGKQDEKGQWFVNQTIGLIKSMETANVASSDGLWLFYSDFFSHVSILGFSQPLAYHISYSRYPGDSMVWINENTELYQMLADWLLLL